MSRRGRTRPERRLPPRAEPASRGRVRQIVLVFVAIFVVTGAFTALHALLPGNPVDQFVGITPIVLIGLVIVTVWLLARQARSR